ncbi:MAG TPA: TraB/GumN family protein [Burkholderiaceae bacterium]|nr:TraB/GumN family protein [Burkholderiaceae bacterium]
MGPHVTPGTLMRRLLLSVVLAALVLPFAAQAGSDGDELLKQAEKQPKRGFFWEAHKADRKIYLFGTVHVGRADFYPPNIEYLRRFNEAKAIVVEADVFNAKRVSAAVQKVAVYPDGEPGLDTRMDDELKARVLAQVRRFGLDTNRIWRMKPWMLANTLVIMQASSGGYSPAYATESFLFQYATGAGKPLLEIESIELQLGIFDRSDQETQIAYLNQAVRGMESGDADREVRKIVEAWERRDNEAAERLVADIHSAKTRGERFVAEQLFDARHPRMVEAIEKYTASGSLYLVAVGSLHYFGPAGLLEILRSRGFTITPVP